MFYRLKRAHAILARQSQIGDAVDQNILIIPAFGGVQYVNLSTIEHVPLPPKKPDDQPPPGPKGSIELEVDYGPAIDQLIYHLRQVVETQIGLFTTSAQKKPQYQVQLNTQVKILEHIRV
jgi:hypothetical protein